MRNRSPAKSAASSPPVPARTSRMALFSSASSLGRSSSRRLLRGALHGLDGVGPLGLGESAHLRIGGRDRREGRRAPQGYRPPPGRRGWPRRPGRGPTIRATGSTKMSAPGPLVQRAGDVGMARQDGVEPLRRQGRGKGHAANPVALGDRRREPDAGTRRRRRRRAAPSRRRRADPPRGRAPSP